MNTPGASGLNHLRERLAVLSITGNLPLLFGPWPADRRAKDRPRLLALSPDISNTAGGALRVARDTTKAPLPRHIDGSGIRLSGRQPGRVFNQEAQ